MVNRSILIGAISGGIAVLFLIVVGLSVLIRRIRFGKRVAALMKIHLAQMNAEDAPEPLPLALKMLPDFIMNNLPHLGNEFLCFVTKHCELQDMRPIDTKQWIKDVEALGPVAGQEPADYLAELLNTTRCNRMNALKHVMVTTAYGAINPYTKQSVRLLTPVLSEFYRYCRAPECTRRGGHFYLNWRNVAESMCAILPDPYNREAIDELKTKLLAIVRPFLDETKKDDWEKEIDRHCEYLWKFAHSLLSSATEWRWGFDYDPILKGKAIAIEPWWRLVGRDEWGAQLDSNELILSKRVPAAPVTMVQLQKAEGSKRVPLIGMEELRKILGRKEGQYV